MPHLYALLALLLALAPQIVRQGDPDAKPIPTAFHSPMVIEVPLVAADRSTWGKGWQELPAYAKIGENTVDGVAIRGRSHKDTWDSGLSVRTVQETADRVAITFRVKAFNPKRNHDKSVMVYFEFLNGDTSVGTSRLEEPIGARDTGIMTPPVTVTVVMPSAVLKSDPMTTVRLTVTAKDW